MNRLALDLDSVVVESFPVEAGREEDAGAAQAYVTAGSRTCLIPFCRNAEVG
ncbi:MAG: hypothetical protein ACJ8GN_29505 [Longimicrobiaceae bacterium]